MQSHSLTFSQARVLKGRLDYSSAACLTALMSSILRPLPSPPHVPSPFRTILVCQTTKSQTPQIRRKQEIPRHSYAPKCSRQSERQRARNKTRDAKCRRRPYRNPHRRLKARSDNRHTPQPGSASPLRLITSPHPHAQSLPPQRCSISNTRTTPIRLHSGISTASTASRHHASPIRP